MKRPKDCTCVKSCWIMAVVMSFVILGGLWLFPPGVQKPHKPRFVVGDIVQTHPVDFNNECSEQIYSTISSSKYDYLVITEDVPYDFEKGDVKAKRIILDGTSYSSYDSTVWICKHAKKIGNLNDKP